MSNKKSIQAYSLAEALKVAQDGALEGYSVDLESNEGYPQQFGSMIVFSLVKNESVAKVTSEETTEVVSDVTAESVPEKKTRINAKK